jgi:hypothetical protein
MKDGLARRIVGTAAAARTLASGLLLTACDTTDHATGGSTNATAPTRSSGSAATRYSRCMRTHGVPAFPLPIDGHIELQAAPGGPLDPASPTFKNAAAVCATLVPDFHVKAPGTLRSRWTWAAAGAVADYLAPAASRACKSPSAPAGRLSAQVGVDGLPADPKLPGQSGFGLAGGDPLAQLLGLLAGECRLAAGVDAARVRFHVPPPCRAWSTQSAWNPTPRPS